MTEFKKGDILIETVTGDMYRYCGNNKGYNINNGSMVVYIFSPIEHFYRKARKEDFKNTKIVVNTPEKSRRFQDFVFSLGIKWCVGGKRYNYLDSKYLYIDQYSNMIYSYNVDGFFKKDEYKEIFYNDLFYDEVFNNEKTLVPYIPTKELFEGKSLIQEWINEYYEEFINTKGGENKMNDIENFNKNNLKLAKKKAIEERNNYEVQEAKKQYEILIDKKEKYERTIKENTELLKEVNEQLKLFK